MLETSGFVQATRSAYGSAHCHGCCCSRRKDEMVIKETEKLRGREQGAVLRGVEHHAAAVAPAATPVGSHESWCWGGPRESRFAATYTSRSSHLGDQVGVLQRSPLRRAPVERAIKGLREVIHIAGSARFVAAPPLVQQHHRQPHRPVRAES